MRYVLTKTSPTSICISKEYDPGEKYEIWLRWNQKDGNVTPEKVERMIPESCYVRKYGKYVVVEFIAK